MRALLHAKLLFAYEEQGMSGHAKKEAERVRELAPNLTIGWVESKLNRYKSSDDWKRYASALRAAGVPE